MLLRALAFVAFFVLGSSAWATSVPPSGAAVCQSNYWPCPSGSTLGEFVAGCTNANIVFVGGAYQCRWSSFEYYRFWATSSVTCPSGYSFNGTTGQCDSTGDPCASASNVTATFVLTSSCTSSAAGSPTCAPSQITQSCGQMYKDPNYDCSITAGGTATAGSTCQAMYCPLAQMQSGHCPQPPAGQPGGSTYCSQYPNDPYCVNTYGSATAAASSTPATTTVAGNGTGTVTGGSTTTTTTVDPTTGATTSSTSSTSSSTSCNGISCTTTATSGNTTTQTVQSVTSYCQTNPNAPQCQPAPSCDVLTDPAKCLGTPASEVVPATTVALYDPSANTVAFASNASCPAPIALNFTLRGTAYNYNISFTWFCSFAETVAPIFEALGAIAAAIVFAAGVLI